MKVYNLFHKIVAKFSGISESEGIELQGEAAKSYTDYILSAKEKKSWNEKAIIYNESLDLSNPDKKDIIVLKKLTMGEVFFTYSDHWIARYCFAILYIILVPYFNRKLREIENGISPIATQNESPMNDYLEFLKFKELQQKQL